MIVYALADATSDRSGLRSSGERRLLRSSVEVFGIYGWNCVTRSHPVRRPGALSIHAATLCTTSENTRRCFGVRFEFWMFWVRCVVCLASPHRHPARLRMFFGMLFVRCELSTKGIVSPFYSLFQQIRSYTVMSYEFMAQTLLPHSSTTIYAIAFLRRNSLQHLLHIFSDCTIILEKKKSSVTPLQNIVQQHLWIIY